jgi:hypothetical protein
VERWGHGVCACVCVLLFGLRKWGGVGGPRSREEKTMRTQPNERQKRPTRQTNASAFSSRPQTRFCPKLTSVVPR